MAEEKATAPRLSRHRAGFVKNRVKRNAQKEHAYDARNYHENANRHGIHCLTKFNCPICHCKNTVRVELDTAEHMALVKCTYCLSLKPRPPDLPYPYATPYVPRLENRADAFFRFSESYRTLVEQQPQQQATGAEAKTHDATGLLGDMSDVLNDRGSSDEEEAETTQDDDDQQQQEGARSHDQLANAKADEGNANNTTADEVDDVAAFFDSDDD